MNVFCFLFSAHCREISDLSSVLNTENMFRLYLAVQLVPEGQYQAHR